MTKKIIALDLDGTLLNSQGEISNFTKKTLKAIEKQGHLLVITTGRPYRMSLSFYDELELTSPMINFNGSLLHIPRKKWEYEHYRLVDRHYLLDMVSREDEFECDFIAGEYRNKFYITHKYLNKINPTLFGVASISPETKLDPNKVTHDPNAILLQTRVNDKYALAIAMKEFYRNELEINTWGGPLNILECAPKGVNKAYALSKLLNSLNLTTQDLIAFGDEHNDTQMLKLAGKGYAMKNANPDLLPYADEQIAWTNDQDGVAHQLTKLFL